MKILLASGSPRRLELLRALGHEVMVKNPNIVEISEGGCADLSMVARENARNKAEHALNLWGLCEADFILSADTIVLCDGELFGKPQSDQEALVMLTRLSGRPHQVITAFCLIGPQAQTRESHVVTQLNFKTLSEQEIVAYIRLNESLDKAGGYGVQGAGAALIDTIHGSITNVIGLPLAEVFHEAKLLNPGL